MLSVAARHRVEYALVSAVRAVIRVLPDGASAR